VNADQIVIAKMFEGEVNTIVPGQLQHKFYIYIYIYIFLLKFSQKKILNVENLEK